MSAKKSSKQKAAERAAQEERRERRARRSPEEMIDAALQSARHALEDGDIERAIETAVDGLNRAEKVSGSEDVQVKLLRALASALALNGQPLQCEETLEEAVMLSASTSEPEITRVQVLLDRAITRLLSGEDRGAEQDVAEVKAALADSSVWPPTLADLLEHLAETQLMLENADDAIASQSRAVEIWETEEDRSLELMTALGQLHGMYAFAEDFDKTQEILERQLEIATTLDEEEDDTYFRGSVWHDYGHFYESIEEKDKAIEAYEKALDFYTQSETADEVSGVLNGRPDIDDVEDHLSELRGEFD